jgi:hypothetical protein
VQDRFPLARRGALWSLRRASTVAALLGIGAALPARPQARPAAPQVNGVAYDIRVTSTPTAGLGMAAAMGAASQDYTGHAVFAGRRGRLDITQGGVASLLNKGDYVLFDSSAIIVVHPAAQEYIPISAQMASDAFAQLQSLGVQVTLGDLKVTLDTLRGADTVAGYPTRHFRMTTAFTMSLDAAIMQQRFAAESITDYWVASVPGLPADALLRVNSLTTAPLAGVFKELAAKVDSAAALMGSAAALKSKTVSRFIQGPGASVTTEQSSEVSNVKHVQVEASLLSVPSGYHKGSIGGEIPKTGRSPRKRV